MDLIGKSDPFVVVFTKDVPDDPWKQIGQTEMIKDNLNPDFEKTLIVSYYFERH